MSDQEVEMAVNPSENVTLSTENDTASKSTNLSSTSDLAWRIRLEHNYFALPKTVPPKPTLRQLICSLHARTSPGDSKMLSQAELKRHVRSGEMLLRRLRRLIASGRRFIEIEPITPLEEAIAQQLSKDMGCETRFYDARDNSRYMVAYRPGTEPNPLEVQARKMCQSENGFEIFNVEEEEPQLEPMSFRDNKLCWHQPQEVNELKSAQDSLSLGRKILKEFNRDYRSKGKEGEGNLDQENRQP